MTGDLIARLREMLDRAEREHPILWSMDADWTHEVLDGEGRLVAKFPLRQLSVPLAIVALMNHARALLDVAEAAYVPVRLRWT